MILWATVNDFVGQENFQVVVKVCNKVQMFAILHTEALWNTNLGVANYGS